MTKVTAWRWGSFANPDKLATYLCLGSWALGALGMAGWFFDVPFLKSVHPALISMKVNTALSIMALSSAVCLLSSKIVFARLVRGSLAAVVVGIALLTLAEYVLAWDAGIDQALFIDPIPPGSAYPPGRMAPITAVCFVLTGCALLLSGSEGQRLSQAAQFLVGASLLAAFQVVIVYLFSVDYSFGLAYYMQMAIHTSLALVTLNLAFLVRSRRNGLMFIMFQPTAGGRVAKRLVLAAILIPPLVNTLILKGQGLQLFDANFGNVMRLTCDVLFFLVIVWRTALMLHRLDEERVAKNEEFHFVSEALPQLVWATDSSGRINYFSKRWIAYTGRPLPPRLNDPELIHPDDRQNSREIWGRAVKRGEPFGMEYRLLHHSGEYRWQLTHAEPYKDEAGRIVRWFGSCMDIHDQKQEQAIREELAIRERAASESSRLKSQFLAGVSHEIRTPINGVIGMTALLLETPLNEEQRGYANAIKASGDALLTVISDILDLSKIEAGKLEFEEADFSFRQMIDEAWSTVMHAVHKKKLMHVTHVDERLPHLVRGDAGRVRQVVTNLLSNAAKFTLEGSIAVDVRLVAASDEVVKIRVEVKDSGIGVPAHAKARLFQAFSQADSSMARRFGGTGLGLSISRHLVERMGGEIGMESQEGCGSAFWFTVSLKPAGAGEATKRAEVRSVQGTQRRARILIAEDMEINRIISVRMVEKLGHEVHVAENGRQAVEAMRQETFDLVLMDCQMPEMDGYEATGLIRRDSKIVNPKAPIIAMTANAMRGEREKCLAAGMNDHISKPFHEGELAIVISKWLSHEVRKNDAA